MKDSAKIKEAIDFFKKAKKDSTISPIEKGRVIKTLLQSRILANPEDCAKVLKISERNAYRFFKYASEISMKDQKELIRQRASIRMIDQFIKVTNITRIYVDFGKAVTFTVENINNLEPVDRIFLNDIVKQIKNHNLVTRKARKYKGK